VLMKKNNILLVTHSFYPDGWGGVHIYVYNLARYLVSSSVFSPHVLTIKMNADQGNEEAIEGIAVTRFHTILAGRLRFILRPLVSIFKSNIIFGKLQKKKKFKIISLHSVIPAFGVLLNPKSRAVKKIFTFHSSFYDDALKQMKKKWLFPKGLSAPVLFAIKRIERFVLKNSDLIIVLSEFSRAYLIENFLIPADKIKIIPGGVDEKLFCPSQVLKQELRRKLDLPQDKKIVVTTRRLVARMGLENLIYAFRLILKKRKDMFLLLIGEGFLRKKLEEIINEEGLKEYVFLAGAKDSRQIPDYYRAADLFVMPSEYAEWFGLSTLEALACGTLSAGTPAGATGEILSKIDKKLVFKDVTPEAMALGIESLLDEPSLQASGAKLRSFVLNNYTWAAVFKKAEKIYSGIIE